jgi:ABC-type Fe3+/spermidine/putrescine transport system ATPase subunit
LVELPAAFAGRTTEGLSGGERQRVALARALAGDPAVLMLDEPLTAIDRPQRAGLRDRLRSLQRERGGLFVHVTHDPAEALALADHLVVLDRGVVLAQGDPEALYTRPPDAATARLLGGLSAVPGAETRSLRCERLRIAEVQPRAHGRVVSRAVLGEIAEIVVAVGSQRVSLHAPLEVRAAVDDAVGLRWEDDDELPFAAGSA